MPETKCIRIIVLNNTNVTLLSSKLSKELEFSQKKHERLTKEHNDERQKDFETVLNNQSPIELILTCLLDAKLPKRIRKNV